MVRGMSGPEANAIRAFRATSNFELFTDSEPEVTILTWQLPLLTRSMQPGDIQEGYPELSGRLTRSQAFAFLCGLAVPPNEETKRHRKALDEWMHQG